MSDNDRKTKLIWVDIMKGILILLMVLGHTYVNFKGFIYLFHIAVFFMIFGYCYSEKHSQNIKAIGKYALQRVLRLYVPFVLINLSYIILNNFFVSYGIYSDSPTFLELTSEAPVTQTLTEQLGFSQTLKAIARTLCFAGGAAKLSGATWFLSTLFAVSLLHCLIVFAFNKLKLNKIVTLSILLTLCLAWAWIVDLGVFKTIGFIDRFPSAYAACLGGALIREAQKSEKLNKVLDMENPIVLVLSIVVSSVILLVFFFNGFHIELAYSEITNPFGYVVVSICGWFLIKAISFLLSKNKVFAIVFIFLGTRTIPILLFHTIAFKLVSFLLLIITNGNMLLLASYPIIFDTPEWFRYIYFFVGIAIPLLIYEPYSFLKRKLLSKVVVHSEGQ